MLQIVSEPLLFVEKRQSQSENNYFLTLDPIRGAGGVGMKFQTGKYSTTTVEFALEYHNLSAAEGHHIHVVRGSTVIAKFPLVFPGAKHTVPPVNYTGSLPCPTTCSGQVSGTVDGLYPGTTYKIHGRIVNAQQDVLVEDTHIATTHGDSHRNPPILVRLHVSCGINNLTSAQVDWIITYQEADIFDSTGISLSHASANSVPSSNPQPQVLSQEVHSSTLILKMGSSVLSGTVGE